jgi:hypothetical protein
VSGIETESFGGIGLLIEVPYPNNTFATIEFRSIEALSASRTSL